MLERPKNYEEAKVIIKNSVGNDFEKYNMKKAKLRSLFITALSLGATAALGLISHSPKAALAMLPGAAIVSLTSLSPFIFQKITNKKVESGKYFKERSEDKIISIANEYVSEYNDFERRRSR